MPANKEAMFISALLRGGDPAPLNRHGITPQLFDVHKDEFKWIWRYFVKYGKLPRKEGFRAKWPHCKLYINDDIDAAADELKQEYCRRAMTDLLDESIDTMLSGDIAKAMETLGTDLLRIQAVLQDAPEDLDIAEDTDKIYKEILNRVEKLKNTGSAGIPTGFETLDLATGGSQPGWYCVLGARYGMGKTWTLVKMACEAVINGYSALYYTLEQPEHQIAFRTHSFFSRYLKSPEVFNNMDLQRGSGFDLIEYKKFLESMQEDLKGRLVINGARRERVSPMTVAAGIERTEPDIVFVDYITLMAMKGDGGWMSVAQLSADLQQLSQRYNVPIWVGSQFNKQNELAKSDNIGMDVDLFMAQKQLPDRGGPVISMEIEKFRHGMGGQKWFNHFDPGAGIFDEISGDEAQTIIQEYELER